MKKIKSLTVFILLLVISVLSVFAFVGCKDGSSSNDSSTEPPLENNNPIDNLVFVEQSDGTYGVKTTNKKIEGALVIPSEHNGQAVTIVLENGFRSCEKLTSVVIPNGVTIIDKQAFAFCYKLDSVTVYPSLKEIRSEAFRLCGEFDYILIGKAEDFQYSVLNNSFSESTPNRIYRPED